jgi:hypothetical protein
MKRSVEMIKRSVFALGVLGSLSFGTAQAFGMSGSKAEAARPWCNPVDCNAKCGGYGICQNNICYCY